MPAGRPAGQLHLPLAPQPLRRVTGGRLTARCARPRTSRPPPWRRPISKITSSKATYLCASERAPKETRLFGGVARSSFSYAKGEGWIFAHHSPSAPHPPCDHTPPPLPSASPPAHCSDNQIGDAGATALASSVAPLTALLLFSLQYAILKFPMIQ